MESVDVLANVRAATPEGFSWEISCSAYERFEYVNVHLVRRRFGNIKEKWRESDRVTSATTPESFRDDVLRLASKILEERVEDLSKPDWAALAKELQAALNGKPK